MKHEEGEEKGGQSEGGERVDSEEQQTVTRASPACLPPQGQGWKVANRTADRKICCFDLNLSCHSPFLLSPVSASHRSFCLPT